MNDPSSKKRLRFALRILLALVACGLLAFLALHFWARNRLAQEMQAVVARGETLSFEAHLPQLSPSEANASHTLNAALALLHTAPPKTEGFQVVRGLVLDEPLQSTDRQVLADLLAVPQNRLALETLDHGRHIQRACFIQGNADAPGLPIHIQLFNEERIAVLQLASLLRARSLVAWEEGDWSGAWRAVAHHFRIASWLEQELPVVTSRILAVAVASRGLDLLQALLHRGTPGPEAHSELAATLASLSAWSPARSFSGERAYFFQANSGAEQFLLFFSSPQSSAGQRFSRRYLLRFIDLAATASSLAYFSNFVDHTATPPHLRNPWPGEESRKRSLFDNFATILIPNLLDAAYKTDDLLTRVALARLALRSVAFLQERGVRPVSLKDLDSAEALATDPYSGGPFHWNVVDGKVHLESAGRDLKYGEGTGDDLRWQLP
jgi:hypothetical protein